MSQNRCSTAVRRDRINLARPTIIPARMKYCSMKAGFQKRQNLVANRRSVNPGCLIM